MKNAKPKMALLVAAALMGMNHAAQAKDSVSPNGRLTPLERLSTEERSRYEQLIRELEQTVRIDWESVILAVDENGNLVIRGRNSLDLEAVREPSCWAAPY